MSFANEREGAAVARDDRVGARPGCGAASPLADEENKDKTFRPEDVETLLEFDPFSKRRASVAQQIPVEQGSGAGAPRSSPEAAAPSQELVEKIEEDLARVIKAEPGSIGHPRSQTEIGASESKIGAENGASPLKTVTERRAGETKTGDDRALVAANVAESGAGGYKIGGGDGASRLKTDTESGTGGYKTGGDRALVAAGGGQSSQQTSSPSLQMSLPASRAPPLPGQPRPATPGQRAPAQPGVFRSAAAGQQQHQQQQLPSTPGPPSSSGSAPLPDGLPRKPLTPYANKNAGLPSHMYARTPNREYQPQQPQQQQHFQIASLTGSGRKARIPWTHAEVEALERGYTEFGGHTQPWSFIIEKYSDYFHESRTNVSLKDKWRLLHGDRNRNSPNYRPSQPKTIADIRLHHNGAAAAAVARFRDGQEKHTDVNMGPAPPLPGKPGMSAAMATNRYSVPPHAQLKSVGQVRPIMPHERSSGAAPSPAGAAAAAAAAQGALQPRQPGHPPMQGPPGPRPQLPLNRTAPPPAAVAVAPASKMPISAKPAIGDARTQMSFSTAAGQPYRHPPPASQPEATSVGPEQRPAKPASDNTAEQQQQQQPGTTARPVQTQGQIAVERSTEAATAKTTAPPGPTGGSSNSISSSNPQPTDGASLAKDAQGAAYPEYDEYDEYDGDDGDEYEEDSEDQTSYPDGVGAYTPSPAEDEDFLRQQEIIRHIGLTLRPTNLTTEEMIRQLSMPTFSTVANEPRAQNGSAVYKVPQPHGSMEGAASTVASVPRPAAAAQRSKLAALDARKQQRVLRALLQTRKMTKRMQPRSIAEGKPLKRQRVI